MSLKADEISAIIKEQIKNYRHQVQSYDSGIVLSVADGITLIQGLEKAMSSELLLFPNDVVGMVLNLEEHHVVAVLFGDDSNVKEGDEVRRTNKVVEVGVGDGLLGRVVNALGAPIDGLGAIETTTFRQVEKVAPGVMTRKSVHQPLMTGLKIIDSLIPIGKGQRELIIGDRQTGKTAVAVDTIINQKGQNVTCIYVAIGQKASTVAQIVEKLRQHDALSYTTIVSSCASDPVALQYLAPYTGCTIGEYWMEHGKDVLIIYDDLSKHAIAYRTMSLLIRRPPGREAYPGDVFYLHSRLLERAAKLRDDLGGGSLTALPIIETQAGDISAYIPTNVISITDGQLFLQTQLFHAGIRPAVDSGLSVSRVGSKAQTKAMKKVASSLKLELAQYHELLAFTQFGSDLDSATEKVIRHGERLDELLKQGQYQPLSLALQVCSLFSSKHGYLEKIAVEDVKNYEKRLHRLAKDEYSDLLERINKYGDFSQEDEQLLHELATKSLGL